MVIYIYPPIDWTRELVNHLHQEIQVQDTILMYYDVALVYVIGWLAVVFGINSVSIVNRKEIPSCLQCYPEYHSLPSCYKLIRQA